MLMCRYAQLASQLSGGFSLPVLRKEMRSFMRGRNMPSLLFFSTALLQLLINVNNNNSWTSPFMLPITMSMLLLGSWMVLVLAERQLERQRGCKEALREEWK